MKLNALHKQIKSNQIKNENFETQTSFHLLESMDLEVGLRACIRYRTAVSAQQSLWNFDHDGDDVYADADVAAVRRAVRAASRVEDRRKDRRRKRRRWRSIAVRLPV